ncbi:MULTISPECIES: ABC transporter ATP-binding protein [Pantoea]|uniref:ABC transporter ATP-binding protein n=1 Tax=Pantoea TaxID=53335 RepID=UPI0009006292|nr:MULTISPECIES: ABC transporter ATP-binding protein [Pantoea]
MIEIKNLTKFYKTKKGKHYIFNDLNIVIPEGKSIALIGRNGAGKSTLMRLIGGIDLPNFGSIKTNKTISWPVGLSGGFQGSLTGRDNVKFVSRLYCKENEIGEKINYVEQFSELGNYFDMPIKTYSSGMKSRLSFGLSMAFNFDYYLVDEVTAVGDAAFKKKCSEIFHEKTISSKLIMVSHSLSSLRKYCDHAIYIGPNSSVQLYEDIDQAIHFHKIDQGV